MAQSHRLRVQTQQPNARRPADAVLFGWLSGLASLAAVIAVIVVMQPERVATSENRKSSG